MLEDYFMSQNVGKAIQHSLSRLDEGEADMDVGGDPGSSLLLDDVFFLLKKCVQRAIGGQNVDGVCAVVNNACRILEQDFCGTLQSQVCEHKFEFLTTLWNTRFNRMIILAQDGLSHGLPGPDPRLQCAPHFLSAGEAAGRRHGKTEADIPRKITT